MDELDKIIEVQCSDGNWNYSPYMRGVANGLIIARSILQDKDALLLEAPTEWLYSVVTKPTEEGE